MLEMKKLMQICSKILLQGSNMTTHLKLTFPTDDDKVSDDDFIVLDT